MPLTQKKLAGIGEWRSMGWRGTGGGNLRVIGAGSIWEVGEEIPKKAGAGRNRR